MKRLVLLLLLLVLPSGPAAAGPRPGFRWPLPGTPAVVRGFEPPRTTYGSGHRGVDLSGYGGETVVAAGAGRVTYAGVLAGRGVVTVTHDNGLRTTYEPVTAGVHVGTLVQAGAPLGRLTAGHASCPAGTACLHWGLLRGPTYLDPLGLLQPPQVRLLPLVGAARVSQPSQRSAPALVRRASEPAPPSGAGRSAGGIVATAALVSGLGLILRRPAPTRPPPGGTLVDLRLERRRRRAA